MDELYPVKKFREAMELSCARAEIQVQNGRELISIEFVSHLQ